jgi:hypothetical protein
MPRQGPTPFQKTQKAISSAHIREFIMATPAPKRILVTGAAGEIYFQPTKMNNNRSI